ncbi:SDR family NAD(P)-dependent oxidoreductase [Streptomyces canus]|uniref:SDR family NAD(P)-dependent oxidoreductase n=1 Tax=Streptomyces canus TaxID=58343 RepID=UPI0030E40D43
MTTGTWLITGVSSGFGHALTTQLLERGDRVIGTVRSLDKVTDLRKRYPDTFQAKILDVTDTTAVRAVVDEAFAAGRVDVIVSNAGYGLFGAAEELTDAQVDHIIATNLTGSITLIRAALPHLRAQGGGRVIQLSSYGGQVAFPGNSLFWAPPPPSTAGSTPHEQGHLRHRCRARPGHRHRPTGPGRRPPGRGHRP